MNALLLASALAIPATPQVVQNMNDLINTHVAVCKKEGVSEEECMKSGSEVLERVKAKVEEVCTKNFPGKHECIEVGFSYLIGEEVKKNIYRLSLRLT